MERRALGERLRALRKARNLSQIELRKRSGLLQGYLSRIENGHIVPSVKTLEKLARGLDLPLYRFFYVGEAPADLEKLSQHEALEGFLWGSSGNDAKFLSQLLRFLRRLKESDRMLLLSVAEKLSTRLTRRKRLAPQAPQSPPSPDEAPGRDGATTPAATSAPIEPST